MERSEDLLRGLAPQVLAAVVRRYGHFDLAEDATQEALLAATTRWPAEGLPNDPKAWLVVVAGRRLTDLLRSEQSRVRREERAAEWTLTEHDPAMSPSPLAHDDTLVLLFLCCHPALSIPSQIALTLKVVGGLTTREIARALLTSEQTVTRRITRAKQSIKSSGVPFALPPDASHQLPTVLHVLYLIFNEGYASTNGSELLRAELSDEAIRLARSLHESLPDDAETSGLLALMLLIHARSPARTAADGSIVPMADQDRALWDKCAINEGVALITRALPRGAIGPYQLQAAIAALHDEARSVDTTDWGQIAALYRVLETIDPSPVVQLNHAVAVAMADGPLAGLDLLQQLASDARVADGRRFHAVRAGLLERAGDIAAALDAYRLAASHTANAQQQRYLQQQISRLRR